MPGEFDYIRSTPPVSPLPWQTWVNDISGDYSVFTPELEWKRLGNLKKENMGFLSTAGGVVDGPITGAHGHAPMNNADILESLRVNGIPVVTEAELGAWSERIKAEINAALNLQRAKDGSGAGLDTTLLGMLQWKPGSIAIKNGKSFNFADPGGPAGDLRPQFTDGSRPTWANCTVIAWIEAMADPKDGGGSMSGDVFIPASFDVNWNFSYPSGAWINWVSRMPPILEAHVREESRMGQQHLAIGYVVIGRR